MAFPKVSVNVTNGNLLRSISVDDVGAIVANAKTSDLVGVVNEVYSLADAEAKGYTEANEPLLYRHISEFYAELGGRQRLFVYGLPTGMTLTEAVTSTTEGGLNTFLNAAGGVVTLVAMSTDTASDSTNFIASDVQSAVTTSIALCEAYQAKNQPFRMILPGIIGDSTASVSAWKPNSCSNGFVAVLVGSTSDDNQPAVGVALARACKYDEHIKLGSGQNGALSAVAEVYIGTDKYEDRLDMETIHDEGFLTFQIRTGASGYYFGRDNMCSSDDFSILVHGRIIDKAQRITAEAYIPYIEDYVELNSDGTLTQSAASDLENVLTQALLNGLAGQMSDVDVNIDTDQDVVNTSTIEVGVRVLPLGYATWINVTLGLSSSNE